METEREERLDSILADYLDAMAAGQAPDRADVLARHPDLADDLTAFFADQDRFDGVMAPLRVSAPSTISYAHNTNVIASEPLHSGASFGDYEILDVVARGGLGVVYRARQKSLNRIVALKMIRAGRWATADDRQRFRLECEAAASLDHPNIVPIYEVGEWRADDLSEPVPFFSMKLIEGGSLAQRGARGEGRGPVEARRDAARLVATVARAVDYAHQRGILHRDLKPANILLQESRYISVERDRGDTYPSLRGLETSSLTPYLTDFGLAKFAHHDQGLTPSGIAVGTPGYMAPEQAFPARTGAAPTGLTTSVDVYGLGAVLYELLVGRPPFHGATILDTLLEVLEKAPVRPRDVVPAIERDLETICLKCLEKDPARRYASAAALADDLDRFLRGEPISARSAGPLERGWLWAKRQPLVAGLWAMLGLAVAIGGTLVTWKWREAEANLDEVRIQKKNAEALAAAKDTEWRRAEGEKERAEKEAGEKERQRKFAEDEKGRAEKALKDLTREFNAVNKALSNLCQRAVNAPSDQPAVAALKRALLDDAARNFEDLLKRKGHDGSVEGNLALTYWHLGVLADSAKQPDEAIRRFEQSQAMYHQLALDSPKFEQHRENEARCYFWLGDLRREKGDSDQAERDYVRAYELFESLTRTEKPNPSLLRMQARSCRSIGHIHFYAKRWDRAEEWFARGVTVSETLIRIEPNITNDQGRLADCILDVAHSQVSAGKNDEGRANYEKAVATFKPLLTTKAPLEWHVNAHLALAQWTKHGPGREAMLGELAASHRRVGRAFLVSGNIGEAMRHYREGRQDAQDWLKREPDSIAARSELAKCWYDLATAHERAGEYDNVVRALETSCDTRRPLIERYPKRNDIRADLGLTLLFLGETYVRVGREDDARAAYAESADIYRKALKDASPSPLWRGHFGTVLARQAEMERKSGRLVDAAAALSERRRLLADQPQDLYGIAREFAQLALRAGQGKTKPSEEEAAAKNHYAALAVDTLKEAVAKGYKDEQMRKEMDFGVLHGRPDFEALFRK
jgi:serine/threonine-protein kinase